MGSETSMDNPSIAVDVILNITSGDNRGENPLGTNVCVAWLKVANLDG